MRYRQCCCSGKRPPSCLYSSLQFVPSLLHFSTHHTIKGPSTHLRCIEGTSCLSWTSIGSLARKMVDFLLCLLYSPCHHYVYSIAWSAYQWSKISNGNLQHTNIDNVMHTKVSYGEVMSYIGGLDPEHGCKVEVNLLHHDGLTLCTANAF